MPQSLSELETPCLIADRSLLEANAVRMRERASRFGFRLRPHLKTIKSAEIGRIAHGGNDGPITVSTLKEAEYFSANGFQDITYAVCITPNKFPHVKRLIDRGVELKVLLASESIANALADFAERERVLVGAMVEIDCGDNRTGLVPGAGELIAAARILEESGKLRFEGLLTHGGHSYAAKSVADIVAAAEDERTSLISAQKRLAENGIETPALSSGSTPTAMLGERFEGLDELRPGVYLAGDLFQAQLGTCKFEDLAVSVLATVIDHAPERNKLVIDAGGLALSKDRSTEHSPVDYGYGLVVRADGTRFLSDLIVDGVSQEHGEVTSTHRLPYGELPVGSQVRVHANHICMTAASYDRYYVVDGGGSVIVDEWDKTTGW